MDDPIAVPTRVGAELYVEVVQFLYREAALLDDGAFTSWLELLTEDFTYEMPLTLTRERSESTRSRDHTMEYFSENLASLRMRVDRLHTEYAWAEDPPTRTRHMVGNVVVEPADEPETLRATCAFAVHASRGSSPDYDVFVGSRRDVIVRRDERLMLRRRTLWLDQAVLGAGSISILL